MYVVDKIGPDGRGAKIYTVGDGFAKTESALTTDYLIRARDGRGEYARKTMTGIAGKVFGVARDAMVNVLAGIKRKRRISSTVKALFVLDDDALRDIGIDRSDIWAVAIALADEAARTEKPKKVSETEAPDSEETAADEDFLPKAA